MAFFVVAVFYPFRIHWGLHVFNHQPVLQIQISDFFTNSGKRKRRIMDFEPEKAKKLLFPGFSHHKKSFTLITETG